MMIVKEMVGMVGMVGMGMVVGMYLIGAECLHKLI